MSSLVRLPVAGGESEGIGHGPGKQPRGGILQHLLARLEELQHVLPFLVDQSLNLQEKSFHSGLIYRKTEEGAKVAFKNQSRITWTKRTSS